ncbi:hypothetical protein [Burkholderia sp. GbtcB21]|uniref:hypothetical protein n=1 Tax=Burkholderia sp. GbtcB21 TaxID=2824766 RepID=UPI001C304A43|nr:hypothetical protein [Burkholderia sp. GbtcB21]
MNPSVVASIDIAIQKFGNSYFLSYGFHAWSMALKELTKTEINNVGGGIVGVLIAGIAGYFIYNSTSGSSNGSADVATPTEKPGCTIFANDPDFDPIWQCH